MWELIISDKVKVIKVDSGFVACAQLPGKRWSERANKMLPYPKEDYAYSVLYQAVEKGIHVAVEMEEPKTVRKYLNLLREFRDEVLSTADFVEYKYKIVKEVT